mmetsp:Transcript_24915/g.69456  ORF Transcript_24915/g.69456 Transcript_24915/m.69456 type:complete len:512 (+) Transcript_24915:1365-2900(+)|eukprot:CAMPEP_0117666172 /NCGR_PEP_ID=MMETSP0804-20121206/10226_1 /TAXON_ID=1074897 /ORGANISM="Tetraselmis astigmatica, Strain CCMP880" /LENGTH=511 /DNA_ID=CAMNT_0005473683 /DNA_START=1470 /DNA_END=3005 /DNA_ORIENTATION=+
MQAVGRVLYAGNDSPPSVESVVDLALRSIFYAWIRTAREVLRVGMRAHGEAFIDSCYAGTPTLLSCAVMSYSEDAVNLVINVCKEAGRPIDKWLAMDSSHLAVLHLVARQGNLGVIHLLLHSSLAASRAWRTLRDDQHGGLTPAEVLHHHHNTTAQVPKHARRVRAKPQIFRSARDAILTAPSVPGWLTSATVWVAPSLGSALLGSGLVSQGKLVQPLMCLAGLLLIALSLCSRICSSILADVQEAARQEGVSLSSTLCMAESAVADAYQARRYKASRKYVSLGGPLFFSAVAAPLVNLYSQSGVFCPMSLLLPSVGVVLVASYWGAKSDKQQQWANLSAPLLIVLAHLAYGQYAGLSATAIYVLPAPYLMPNGPFVMAAIHLLIAFSHPILAFVAPVPLQMLIWQAPLKMVCCSCFFARVQANALSLGVVYPPWMLTYMLATLCLASLAEAFLHVFKECSFIKLFLGSMKESRRTYRAPSKPLRGKGAVAALTLRPLLHADIVSRPLGLQ